MRPSSRGVLLPTERASSRLPLHQGLPPETGGKPPDSIAKKLRRGVGAGPAGFEMVHAGFQPGISRSRIGAAKAALASSPVTSSIPSGPCTPRPNSTARAICSCPKIGPEATSRVVPK